MNQIKGELSIVRGSNFEKTFKFRTNGGIDSVDLQNITEATISFPLADGTRHISTFTTHDAETRPSSNGEVAFDSGAGAAGANGNLIVTLATSVTDLLKEGEGQTVEVSWVIAGKTSKVILEKILSVYADA